MPARSLSGPKNVPTQKELNSIRSAMKDTFPDLCDIYTLTERVDGIGSVVQYWTATYRNVPCQLVTTKSGREGKFGDAITGTGASHAIRMPYDQTLTNTMRIVHNNTTYEILRVDKGSSTYGAVYATLVRLESVTTVSMPEQALPPALPEAPAASPRYGAFDENFDIDYMFD